MNLTSGQRKLFEALHDSRLEDYKVFSKKDYKGLFESVIDKYPETAHFIYELLQNADDANATDVYFVLNQDTLIFKHNGTKHFDVTPVGADIVGDINSITGIGNSSKTGETTDTQNKIGKFGVGFKSVFKYTDSPEIYDDTYCFKINNIIIPTLLDNDHPDRKHGETLFVFKFPEAKRQKSYTEIRNRLTNLQNPILFLRHLQKITWRIDSSEHEKGQELTYEKKLIEKIVYKDQDVTLERYHLAEPKRTNSIFLFSREIIVTEEDKESKHLIYIGFYYDEEKKQLNTSDKSRKIYCFFPTDDTFDTCFISHAPFLLIENRQNIKRDESLNKDLLRLLANLAKDSIVILRDYGIQNKNLLINENLTDIIPEYDIPDDYYYYDDDEDEDSKETFFHDPISEAFKELIDNEPLILSRGGEYLLPSDAYLTRDAIYSLVSQKQLEILEDCEGIDFAQWELIQNINKFTDNFEFFADIKDFGVEEFGRCITADFMNSQAFEWVTKFYTFIREHASVHINISSQSKELVFRSAPIIKTQKDEWVAPFSNKTEPNIFLPFPGSIDKSLGYNFVNDQYLNDAIARKFFTQLELKTPDEYDHIRNIILKKYTEDYVDIPDNVVQEEFFFLLTYYQKVLNTDKEAEFIKLLQNELQLVGTDGYLHHPSELYFETPELTQYFGGNSKAAFFDLEYYQQHNHTLKTSFINDFAQLLGVSLKPRIIEYENRYSWNIPPSIKKLFPEYRQNYYNIVVVEDKRLDGFDDAYNSKRISKEVSIYLWNVVVKEIFSNYIRSNEHCIIRATTQRRRTAEFYYKELKFFHQIKQYKWIYDKDGNRHNVQDIFIEDLAPEYIVDEIMIDFLGLQHSPQSHDIAFIEENCSESTKEAVLLGQSLKKYGITEKDLPELIKLKEEKTRREFEAVQEAERKRIREEKYDGTYFGSDAPEEKNPISNTPRRPHASAELEERRASNDSSHAPREPYSPKTDAIKSEGIPVELATLEMGATEEADLRRILNGMSSDAIANNAYLANYRLFKQIEKWKNEHPEYDIEPEESEADFIRNIPKEGGVISDHRLKSGKFMRACSAAGGVLYLSPGIWNMVADNRCMLCIYRGADNNRVANEFLLIKSYEELLQFIGHDDLIVKVTGEHRVQIVEFLYNNLNSKVTRGTVYCLIRVAESTSIDNVAAPVSSAMTEQEDEDSKFF